MTDTPQVAQTESPKRKIFDLEERTLKLAAKVNTYVRQLPKDIPNIENGRQLARSGGSVGANYIEGNESLGKKDFQMRIRISRKEAKESRYWLNLLDPVPFALEKEHQRLIGEVTELLKILSAIVNKVS